MQKRVGEYDTKMDSAFKDVDKAQGEVKAAEGLKPPDLQLPPQPTVKQTDPQKVWTSAAMVLAAVGSLWSRQSITSAMTAATGVINAYRQGDQEAANAALASWKINNENLIKIHDYQQEAYRDALSAAQSDEKGALSKAQALGYAMNDPIVAESRTVEELGRILEERDRQMLLLQESIPKVLEGAAAKEAAEELQASPEYQRADKIGKAKMFAKLMNEVAPSTYKMTEPQQYAAEDKAKKALMTSAIGKAWSAATEASGILDTLTTNPNAIKSGVISQAAVADKFTQVFNGGRAIRGFQMKMNTDHASLWDKAEVALQQFNKGGALSPQQQSDMLAAVKLTVEEIKAEYAKSIEHEQATSIARGLDGDAIIPDDFDPSFLPSAGSGSRDVPGAGDPGGGQASAPPPEAIAALKADRRPNAKAQFDEVFGPGAAARVLGH